VIVLLVLAGLLVGAYYGIVAGARAAVRAVPMSVDATIGDVAFEGMEMDGPEVKDPLVVGAVQKMVDRLSAAVNAENIDFRVTVVDAPVVNAFALPGGRIVVYTGLIDKAAEPEQVAGVLGHEMAHVTMRHGMERIAQSIGLVAAIQFFLGDVQGLAALGAEVLQVATINSYSRDQEAAADAEGVRTLHAAGIDPLSLARFFELLKNEHGDLPGAISWISTHPQHDARIAAIRSQLKELPPQEYRPLEIDWSAVQQRVRGKPALPQPQEPHDGR
jgi:predicted Zn-dependent protease